MTTQPLAKLMKLPLGFCTTVYAGFIKISYFIKEWLRILEAF